MPPVSQDPLYLFEKVKQDWAVSGCEITITGNNKCLKPIVHSCNQKKKKNPDPSQCRLKKVTQTTFFISNNLIQMLAWRRRGMHWRKEEEITHLCE